MIKDNLVTSMSFIFSSEDLGRINICSDVGGQFLQVDVHGMRCAEAKRFLKNLAVVASSSECRIDVIHGYNHGHAIKQMLQSSFKSSHVTYMSVDECNPGLTHMMVV